MRAAGAAILGAAVVGTLLVVATGSASAAQTDNTPPPDFDVDAEVTLAHNYYAQALTNPIMWSDGQLKSLEGLLTELGFDKEAANIKDMRIGMYGDTAAAPEALPDISFIPQSEIDAIADQTDQDVADLGAQT